MTASNKPISKVDIYAISGDDQYLADMVRTLGSFYRVSKFKDATAAAGKMATSMPAALVVDEHARPMNGEIALKELARHRELDRIPLVCTASPDKAGFIAQAKRHIPNFIILKPYKAREILTALSSEVNAGVEAEWEKLEPTPRTALTKTVSMFHQITDLIDTGQQLPYQEVQECCAPLVEAVQTNQYKGILRGVRSHDNYSYVHSLRVATFLSLFGHAIGMGGDELLLLSSGGLLHDVGKQSIPFEVLNKPGKLDDKEWETMRSHVTRTIDYLKVSSGIPNGVMTIAAQHHEKLDGSGYPNGLKGSELNDLARMAAIVDVFGALTDRRVYKPPMPPEKALTIMAIEMSEELDMKFLALFREMLLEAATDSL